jgi:hypothetical protein
MRRRCRSLEDGVASPDLLSPEGLCLPQGLPRLLRQPRHHAEDDELTSRPATPPAWSLSADKVMHVVDPDRADQDQIDRYNIVQERWLHASGQAIAYIYSRANATEALQAKMLTEDEARRVAVSQAAGAAWEDGSRIRSLPI